MGNGVDSVAMTDAPMIDGCLLPRWLVVLLRELEEKGAIWILLSCISGVDGMILHELVGHPAFDLLVNKSMTSITNKAKLTPWR